MVVLDVKLHNFYAFRNFHINFTYPKKILDSSIANETLPSRPNFRYKKINILLGANASGKTTFGRMLMKIFNFIDKKNFEYVTDSVCDVNEEAYFAVDLASKNCNFYRVVCRILPQKDGKYSVGNVQLAIQKEQILARDSYESCVRRIERLEVDNQDIYIEELEKIEELDWLFVHPDSQKKLSLLPDKNKRFCAVLQNVLRSLDPSIKSVGISNDVDNAYVIRFANRSIVLQNGQSVENSFLSSGTQSGVLVAYTLYALMQGLSSFYYCDEKFSYIHSDIEKAILSLMIDFVGPCDQLFFTTHNTDVLDMNLPKHTFSFLRKDVSDPKCPITCVSASSILKRSTDSVRNALENDLFLSAPSTELIYAIADLRSEE